MILKYSSQLLLSVLIAITIIDNCESSIDKNKEILDSENSRLLIECTIGMFNVIVDGLDVYGQEVHVKYRLLLNGTSFDLVSHTLVDYLNKCLKQVVFRGYSLATARYTYSYYIARESDNFTTTMSHVVGDLDALANYDFQVGYQLKENVLDQIYVTNDRLTTCFGPPLNPSNVTATLYYNASFLIHWNEPPVVYNSPPVCYYIVSLQYQGQSTVREIIVRGSTQYHLSKSESRSALVVRVYSVNEASCLLGTYPFVTSCKNQTLRSVIPSSLNIYPAWDYTTGQSSYLQTMSLISIVFIQLAAVFISNV